MLRCDERVQIEAARAAAIEVLMHNRVSPYRNLPRTAGWGYPEPYTRDLMLSAPGLLVSGEPRLVAMLERTLRALAKNQSGRGHIPSLAHDPEDRGASDTTPLFLLGLSLYRAYSGDEGFLAEAAERALTWISYQSPDDAVMVAQLPTSDWRDEQSVFGYGLYVNATVYAALRLFGKDGDASTLRELMNRLEVEGPRKQPHVHEGLVVRRKPYYALYSYKTFNSDRFDLLGNSLAALFGVASRTRSRSLVGWVEAERRALVQRGELSGGLPPCLFPYIRPEDPDWRPRYETYNRPGEYHNGGVWPFVCGYYVAACVAAGRLLQAERSLVALTEMVRPARNPALAWGFNEWLHAYDARPAGQDWQTWSAALYLYAAECVVRGTTPWFDEIRLKSWEP